MRFIFYWFLFFQEQDPKRISVDGLERHRDERTEPRALQARDLGILPHTVGYHHYAALIDSRLHRHLWHRELLKARPVRLILSDDACDMLVIISF